MKKEWDDWTKTYHKMLKRLEAMIDVQRQVKDMMKIAAEASMTITEMEDTILKASTNNWVINATNIAEVSENLRYLIQSDMEDWVFQIQWMLADKLDVYREKGNKYMNDNIKEIQELYKNKEMKKEEERVEDKEVILVRLYKVSTTLSLSSS